MSKPAKPFSLYRFLFQSLDPVHVGVGGYRLGRVDLPTAREPGTNLPELPGTGIAGAARHYAALQAGRLRCAGQGSAGEQEGNGSGHCGRLDECPICYTFGTLRAKADGEETVAVAGRMRIYDARMLLFPVATFQGPVWVTSPQTLVDFGLEGFTQPASGKARASFEIPNGKSLNLGWLMVEVEGKFTPPNSQGNSNPGTKPATEHFGQLPEYVHQHLVLIGEDLFSTVVNSNLEVRTSVSIDPETGAARQGALFTYEALPRASFFYLDVVEEHQVAASGQSQSPFPWPKNSNAVEKACVAPEAWKSPLDVVSAGFDYFEFLGVGGMATRGFGRLKQIASREVTSE